MPNLIQFEGRTVAVIAPEDLEQLETDAALGRALRETAAGLRSEAGDALGATWGELIDMKLARKVITKLKEAQG